MFIINSDLSKNRLEITLKGDIDDKQIKSAIFKVLYELNKLRPGLDIIKNMSEISTITPSARIAFSRAMEIANGYGVNRVVYVLGASEFDPQSKITSKNISSRYKNYAAVNSIKEAENVLEN